MLTSKMSNTVFALVLQLGVFKDMGDGLRVLRGMDDGLRSSDGSWDPADIEAHPLVDAKVKKLASFLGLTAQSGENKEWNWRGHLIAWGHKNWKNEEKYTVCVGVDESGAWNLTKLEKKCPGEARFLTVKPSSNKESKLYHFVHYDTASVLFCEPPQGNDGYGDCKLSRSSPTIEDFSDGNVFAFSPDRYNNLNHGDNFFLIAQPANQKIQMRKQNINFVRQYFALQDDHGCDKQDCGSWQKKDYFDLIQCSEKCSKDECCRPASPNNTYFFKNSDAR